MSSYSRPSTSYSDYFPWYCSADSVYSGDSTDPPQIACSTESQPPTPFSVHERMELSLERHLALLSVQNDMAPPARTTILKRSPPPPTLYDGEVQFPRLLCHCNIEPMFRTCYMNKNAGRRYFICVNSGTLKNCGFIHWLDEPLCDRGVEFALEVLEENKRLKKELARLH